MYWSAHFSVVLFFIGQPTGSKIAGTDRNGPSYKYRSDQTVRVVHCCKSWFCHSNGIFRSVCVTEEILENVCFLSLHFYYFRPEFTSTLVRGLAFGTPRFNIALYGKIHHELVNPNYSCDVKFGP